MASSSDHDSKQLLFNFFSIILFKMFVVFEIYEVRDFAVLAPKIPYYITYDPEFDIMRLIWSKATVPLLTLI